MDSYRHFETERLILRPSGLEDAELVLELLNMPKWLKFIGDRNVKTLEEAQEYIKTRMLPQLERLGYSNYTMITKSDRSQIGTCGLYDREGLEGIDIGFALLPKYEGQNGDEQVDPGYPYDLALRVRVVTQQTCQDECGVVLPAVGRVVPRQVHLEIDRIEYPHFGRLAARDVNLVVTPNGRQVIRRGRQ